VSWKYQRDIVKFTPRPKHFIEIKFEDLVKDQFTTLARLGSFLGTPLREIQMNVLAVGRWRIKRHLNFYDEIIKDNRYS
jgi:hypothetical protein